ncbi:MAG: hypothetical protein N5P05_001373 [Chroococcopsis gigantea SAG 12.99]|jgi:hypothetical protein|nr:ATP-dependent zinc protease [Chlorogloea purpurea SAG 13.99]MDV2999767.1 hypothetical protein [Chroococcopsis gigantea SAG 12.99]
MKVTVLPIIGWREWVNLPDLSIVAVKAKIDTGARSSALHAFAIQSFYIDGREMIRFHVHPYQRDDDYILTAEAPVLDWRQVRNSGGISEERPVIVTTIELGQTSCTIELTLTNRDVMGFRMLLGREAIRNRFLVHPGRSFLLGNRQ